MMHCTNRKSGNRHTSVKPFCDCFDDGNTSGHLTLVGSPLGCRCGEHVDVNEWKWEVPASMEQSWVKMTDDQRQVTFHPYYSSGTAVVRGTTPMLHDYHYYWEVKMLSEPYGTDIMIGLGTEKVDILTSRYRFISLLGQNVESYGLSYKGIVRHNGMVTWEGPGGFCKGSIIGVKVDLWQGTLEFFLNRQPKGVSFYNLRRHPSMSLFPMLSSTAAQSSMRLIYAGSWQASLLVDAAKILGASVNGDIFLPPGLKNRMKTMFWLTLPNDSCVLDEQQREARRAAENRDLLVESDEIDFLSEYNSYYMDSVDSDHRIAIIYDDL